MPQSTPSIAPTISEITSGAVLASTVVKMNANRKSFQANTMMNTEVAIRPAYDSGNTMRHRVCSRVAPSIAAASSSSRGNWSIKAFMIQAPRLRKNAQYNNTSTVRVSLSISQLTAGNSGKVMTIGGNSRTRIMKKAEPVSNRPSRREYT